MQGDLSFMGADSISIEKGKLTVKLSSLTKGKYRIETFHHSRKSKGKLTNKIEVSVTDANGSLSRKSDDQIIIIISSFAPK